MQRLTRSAAQLEAEMNALSGLLGEEDAAVSTVLQGGDSTRQKLEETNALLVQENASLRRLLNNIKPFAQLHGELVPSEAAGAMRERIAAMRSLVLADDDDLESPAGALGKSPRKSCKPSESFDPEVEGLLKRGGWGGAARRPDLQPTLDYDLE